MEFLAQLAALDTQVVEVRADIALSEGLQRRVAAQVRSPERDAEPLGEVWWKYCSCTIKIFVMSVCQVASTRKQF